MVDSLTLGQVVIGPLIRIPGEAIELETIKEPRYVVEEQACTDGLFNILGI